MCDWKHGDLQRCDAREVADERHVDQVGEQARARVLVGVAGVRGDRVGAGAGVVHADGGVRGGLHGPLARAARRRHRRDAVLEVADFVEVALETLAIGGAHFAENRRALGRDEREHALARAFFEIVARLLGVAHRREAVEERAVHDERARLRLDRLAVARVRDVLAAGEARARQVPDGLRAHDERVERAPAVRLRDDLIRGRAPAREVRFLRARAAEQRAAAAAVEIAERAARGHRRRFDRARAERNRKPRDETEVAHQAERLERHERRRDRVARARFGRHDEVAAFLNPHARYLRAILFPRVAADRLTGEDDRVAEGHSAGRGECRAVVVQHALEHGQRDADAAEPAEQRSSRKAKRHSGGSSRRSAKRSLATKSSRSSFAA